MTRLQKTIGLCACLSLPILMGTKASADNLVLNPGFESGSLAPWFQSRTFGSISENWNVTSADAHSGTFSATDVGNAELRQDITPTAASSITEVSFWAKHPDAGVVALAVDFFYTDSTDNEFVLNTSDTNWDFFNVTSDLNPTKTLSGFSVFGNSGGRTYLDDVSILTPSSAVPEPGSVAMFLGMGLTGAGLLLKKRRR